MKNPPTNYPASSDFSRRSVLRATAWSVPVVAMAASAPAAAASTTSFNLTFSAIHSTTTGPIQVGSIWTYELSFPSNLTFTNGPVAIPTGATLSVDLFWIGSFGSEIGPSSSTHTVTSVAPFGSIDLLGPIGAGAVVLIDLSWDFATDNWEQFAELLDAGEPVTLASNLTYDNHTSGDTASIEGTIFQSV